MTQRSFEALAEILNRVVRGLDIERPLLAHAVEPIWPRAVGERIAANTRVAYLRAGVLTVEARSAAWLNEVSMLRETIREQINREMNASHVREVRFRLGGAFPPLVRRDEVPPPGPSESEIAAAAEELSQEGAGDGAELAARALALQRKRAGSKR